MRRITLFLFLLLVLPTVSAQFLAYGTTEIQAKPCEITTHNLTVQNTKAYTSDFSISVAGEGAAFLTFSQIIFTLEPQESITVQSYYSIPCEAEEGSYPISIYFYDGEDELELQQQLEIRKDSTLAMKSDKTSQVITPCAKAEYVLNLSNPSNITDVFTLSSEGHDDIIISPTTIVLLPEEEKTATIKLEPQDCTESGTFPITITAESEKTTQEEKIELEAIITKSDIARIAEGVNQIKTDYTDSTAELKIKNIGDRTTTYTISVTGPEWASLTPETITLEPNQEKTLNLRLAPEPAVREDEYEIEVTATVDETGIAYTRNLQVKLARPGIIEKHPGILIAIAVVILLIAAALIALLIYSRTEKYKKSKAKRKERKEQKRKLREQRKKEKQARRQRLLEKRKALREAKLKRKQKAKKEKEREEARIAKKEAKEEARKARIKTKIEKEFKRKYHFIPKDEIVEGKRQSAAKHYLTLFFLMLVLILAAAFWNYIEPNLIYLGVGIIILAALYIIKKIVRTTALKARWRLITKEQIKTIKGWKAGLRELEVKPEKSTRNYQIRLTKRSNKNVPAPAVYKTFSVAQNAEAELTATLAVSKKWLAKKRIDIETLKLLKFINHKWRKKDFDKKGEDRKYLYLKSKLDEGTYSICGKPAKQKKAEKTEKKTAKKPKKPRKPMSKKSVLVIGILLLAILTGLAVFLVNPITVKGAIPPQTWKQDTVHKIYLADYFSDPDGDKLTYSSTQTQHITVDFVENTAILTPDKGFIGEEKIKITATDKQGQSVTSNSIPLRVQKNVIPVQIQPVLAAALSIIAVLVLIWMVIKLKKK